MHHMIYLLLLCLLMSDNHQKLESLTGDAKGLTRVSLLIFELQAVMTLFQEACEAFKEPRWQQSLILVKSSINFKLLLHWAKIKALELK